MKKFATMLLFTITFAGASFGQITNSQENFHDFFASAGYGTAFGAALGAATLPFKNNPEKHLRSVAIGASLGFFTGSLLGSYIIFSPAIATKEVKTLNKLTLAPITEGESFNITGITGTWTVKQF